MKRIILALFLLTSAVHADPRETALRRQVSGAVIMGFAVGHLVLMTLFGAMSLAPDPSCHGDCEGGTPLPQFGAFGSAIVGITLSGIGIPLYAVGTEGLKVQPTANGLVVRF